MYEERKVFSLRDIIIQLVFVVLFVLVMIWLFPSKSYLDEKYATNGEVNDIKESLQVLYGQAFANNVDNMRVAATNYFTKERLPEEVGDSVTLTLGEMYEKKLVLEFKDSNNQACDVEKSFVTITKFEDEYQMKVQLTCSDYADYIISYLGCYEYCDECEEEVVTTKPSTSTTSKPNDPQPVSKTYQYEYIKTWQNEWSDWSNWSAWSTTKVSTDNNTRVEIKQEKVFQGYEQIWGITGYKDVTTYEYQVQGGTTLDTKPATQVTTKGYYTDWYNAGTVTVTNGQKYNTTTTKYTLLKVDFVLDCENNCKTNTVSTYSVQKRDYVQGGIEYNCDAYPGYNLSGTNCVKTIDNSTTVEVPIVTKQPVYGYINGDPIYTTVTKYRYSRRTLIKEAGSDIKWSTSQNDANLLNAGYKLTGNSKEV